MKEPSLADIQNDMIKRQQNVFGNQWSQAERVAHANALLDQIDTQKVDAAMDEAAEAIGGEVADAAKEFDVVRGRGGSIDRQWQEWENRHPIDQAMTAAEFEADPTPPLPKPSFLSQRRAAVLADLDKMRARKAQTQAEIARHRRSVFELTQSIRAYEDALDRLAEGDG